MGKLQHLNEAIEHMNQNIELNKKRLDPKTKIFILGIFIGSLMTNVTFLILLAL